MIIFVGVKQRIYIDTSVIGGYFDEEFEIATKEFFKNVFNSESILVISRLLDAEISNAPKIVMEFYKSFPDEHIEFVEVNEDARNLADKYVNEKVVGKSSISDCQHIAIATLCKANVLVSWNFKHMVNLDRIRGYNGINYQFGHNMLEIRTPKEIAKYGNED